MFLSGCIFIIPAKDVCSALSSQEASVSASLFDKSIVNNISNAFKLIKARHRLSSVFPAPLACFSDWCHIWREGYIQSGVTTTNQILEMGVPASLTPWPLPGNWDCCFTFQSMERSCRGLHEEGTRRNYHYTQRGKQMTQGGLHFPHCWAGTGMIAMQSTWGAILLLRQ